MTPEKTGVKEKRKRSHLHGNGTPRTDARVFCEGGQHNEQKKNPFFKSILKTKKACFLK
jgi:hypothetical protein